jgi:integrase/recombinase XerD
MTAMETRGLSGSRVTGPLAAHASGFASQLASLGYAGSSVRRHLVLMAQLSAWLEGEGLQAGQLSPAMADRFVLVMRLTRTYLVSARALVPLLEYLRDLGAVPPCTVQEPAEGSPEGLLRVYQEHLRSERGVCERTVEIYAPFAQAFLAALARLGGQLPQALADLTGAQVLGVVSGQVRSCTPASAGDVARADRSVLRFLHAAGWIPRSLEMVIPKVARRWPPVPAARPDAAAAAAMLASCDRETEVGRRDYAVLVLLGRLGLRSCEVAGLTLDDLHWRRGEVTVRGKGGRVDVLPLPWDVGEALAGYLAVRPAASAPTRAVFITVRAPRRPLAKGGVASVVQHACLRSGVVRCGPHSYRHALGRSLLAAGASLPRSASCCVTPT